MSAVMPSLTVGTILASGSATFDGLFTQIQSVMSEFIPYLVYVGLGVLVATLGFVAIKWLLNWTSSKVRGTFSSRRKRR